MLDIHVPCKVLGTLRTTTALMRVFMYFILMALCHSYVNYMLSTDINITETTYYCQFSGHYLRNRSTLEIGVLGYIGIL